MWIVYLITYRIEEYYDVFEKFYETERNMILALDGRKVELAIYDNEVARTLMQNLDEEVRTAVGDRFIQEFRK
ncbi:MAG: hypothetical protein LBP89_05550 [Helicobacteraceae bacterium]|nr:hypothetical protein [Helicobacteraceae bacterium]